MLDTGMGEFLNLLLELGKIPLFKFLNNDEKRQILSICEVETFRRNEMVFSGDETGDSFYVVIYGTLLMTVGGRDGKEELIAEISPGDYFGEEALFLNARRVANVYPATEEAKLIRITREKFFCFIRTYPAGGAKILLLMINGLLRRSDLSCTNREGPGKVVPDQTQANRQIRELLELMKNL